MLAKDAPTIWNALKGIICVYKPADVSCNRVAKTVIHKICSELNEMDCRPPIDYVSIEGDPSGELTVITKPSLADDPLVVGPRYQPKDIRCTWSSYLGVNTSGVLLLGIQNGTKLAMRIRNNKLVRAYRIKGLLGLATDNYYKDGKVVEKSTFKFIKAFNIEKLLASMQAAHQRKMFDTCGVDLQSQAAYELAVKGPIRPSHSKIPLIYGIKCVHFEPPEFTIEVHCINEYEMYLKALMQEIGMKLHSTAHCTGIQCIRHSYFNLDHALLQKHWTLQNIITNLEECNDIIEEHKDLTIQENIALQYG
ncbi:hypothetical protein ILUMI_11827 [Ignelater luminosus]|uniref:Pseudouridine synthase II N-terminal domain-containing protein n=1 Tax=Ignelater luminosus TaxID=2038154 RepID=A0A8K0CXP7_IGNLU|nr:hypothetical protein ILUMI_11827 [Ignelater luminosus]